MKDVYPWGLEGKFKDWRSKPESWFASLTDVDVKEFREACQEFNATVAKIHAERTAILEESRSKIISLYANSPGTYKREISQLKKLTLWSPSRMDEHGLSDRIKAVKDKKEKEEREANRNNEQVMMIAQAILWLQAKGKVLGVDFYAHDAVDQANYIAEQEEIARRIQLIKESGALIEFNGQNCDECEGWDGESRRCSCGNRRVSWESDGTFLNPRVYGEAY